MIQASVELHLLATFWTAIIRYLLACSNIDVSVLSCNDKSSWQTLKFWLSFRIKLVELSWVTIIVQNFDRQQWSAWLIDYNFIKYINVNELNILQWGH